MTIDVIDGLGAHQAVQLPNANGRAAAVSSKPVALSNEDKAALDLLHTDLGAVATAAAQTTAQTSLTAIAAANGTTADAAWAAGNGTLVALLKTIATGILSTTPQSVNVLPTAAANGATSSRVNAAATTNATSLKAAAGNLVNIDVFNVAAYMVFLKIYDKATAPVVGTDTPIWTIPIAAGTGYSREFVKGKSLAAGIAYAITKLQADTDATVVVAGDLTGSIDWI